MNRLMKYFCLIFILVFMFLNIGAVYAEQANIEITQLETQIMPEYDTTDILMINSIKFTNKSTADFSGELKWRVPKGSSKQIVTENVNSANGHQQYNLVQGKDYDELVWKLSKPLKAGETKDIHLEYYYNNLQGNPDKQFVFDLNSPYSIVSAKMFVLQPLKASNFKVTPDFGQPRTNQEWTYYTKNLNNLPADQKFAITVSYSKSDPTPSINPNQQAQNNQSQNQTNSNPAPASHKISIFAGIVILIIIISAVAYTILQRNNRVDEDEEDDEDEDDEDDQVEIEDDQVDAPNDAAKKSSWLKEEKRKLRKQLEQGRILEIDYYEAISDLEEKEKECYF